MDDIKVTCINPLCDDEKDHLWINLDKMVYHCWKCDFGGKIVENKDVMRLLQNIKKRKPVKKTSTTDSLSLIKADEFVTISSLKPEHQARKYLLSRGISVELCEQIGGMYSPGGKLYGRIVFPIKSVNTIVGWQGRSIYDKIPKYIIFGKKSAGMYSMHDLNKYNKFVIIFEGVFDVLKIPDYGISILGKKISPEQMRLLSTFLNVKTVFVMLDSDANKEEMTLCNSLSMHFKTVPIQLKSGDPGNLSENEILELCVGKLK